MKKTLDNSTGMFKLTRIIHKLSTAATKTYELSESSGSLRQLVDGASCFPPEIIGPDLVSP